MKRIVAGARAVTEALRGAPRQLSVIYVDDLRGQDELERQARQTGVRIELASREHLDALSKGLRHQGVLAIAGEYPYVTLDDVLEHAATSPLIVALDQVTDPHNFGAILRSACAFSADGVVTLRERACPVTPVVVRTSTGATERIRIARVPNLSRAIQVLQRSAMQVVGLAADGTEDLRDLPYDPAGRVLVVGSEGAGLRRLVRENCDVLARIPLAGPIESLNASVAAAIALHESSRARAALQSSQVP